MSICLCRYGGRNITNEQLMNKTLFRNSRRYALPFFHCVNMLFANSCQFLQILQDFHNVLLKKGDASSLTECLFRYIAPSAVGCPSASQPTPLCKLLRLGTIRKIKNYSVALDVMPCLFSRSISFSHFSISRQACISNSTRTRTTRTTITPTMIKIVLITHKLLLCVP